MSVDELKGVIRTLAFGASVETQFNINEALALIDSLAAKSKSYDTLAKGVDPDSWKWLPTQRR